MKITASVILATALFFAISSFAFSQDATSPASTRQDRVQERRQTIKDNLQQKRKNLQEKREDIKERVQKRRENFEERLQERKERIASRAAALKEKLAKFKDKVKAERVERINTRLNQINDKRTDQMLKHLKNMSSILSRLESRVNQATQNGKGTSAATAVIASAKASIETAKTAVETQAENDYSIDVSSESTIREDSKSARDKLHSDLSSVRELVIAAKQAVANAIRTAATTLGRQANGQ